MPFWPPSLADFLQFLSAACQVGRVNRVAAPSVGCQYLGLVWRSCPADMQKGTPSELHAYAGTYTWIALWGDYHLLPAIEMSGSNTSRRVPLQERSFSRASRRRPSNAFVFFFRSTVGSFELRLPCYAVEMVGSRGIDLGVVWTIQRRKEVNFLQDSSLI